MKAFRGTFGLAFVAVLVGLYIYFIEIKKKEADEKAKDASEKVFSIGQDKVKGLKIKNNFGDFELEKGEDGKWGLKFPISDSADQQIVSSMVDNLLSEKFDEVVSEDTAELKSYGLVEPKVSVTLLEGPEKSQTVLIGADGAIPGKLYMMRQGESKVLFGSNGIKTQIERPLKELRDKRIYRGKKEDIAGYDIKYARSNYRGHLELKKIDGKWNIVTPIKEVADSAAVSAFETSLLENLKAVDFPSEGGNDQKNIKKFHLDRPEIEIVLKDKEGKDLDTVIIGGKKDNNHYANVKGQAPIYLVTLANVEAIVKKADDFRDKSIPFVFKKDDVKQVSVKTSLVDVNLVKKENNWEFGSEQKDKKVNQLQVNNLLDKLSQMKVSEFLTNESPRGLSKPKGKIDLKDKEGQLLFSVAWGDKTKSMKSYFVQTNKFDKPVGVEVAQIDSLPGQTLVEEAGKEGAKPAAPPVSADPPLPGEKGTSDDGHGH